MKPPSDNWTMASTNTLPTSTITQSPTFIPPTSQLLNSQPVPYPYTFNTPTCAIFSNELQTFVGTASQYRPENFLNGIKTRTIYQLGTEPTNPEQYWIRNFCSIAHAAISLDCLASSSFKSLSATDTRYWSIYSTNILNLFDIATIKFNAQTEAQIIYLAIHESSSIYACHFESLVNKGWPEFD